jgi:hypothetical protein
MKEQRTKIDFANHEVIVTDQPGLLVHYLKKPGTINDSIKFINTNGILAVTGDYGNWIFCREFHPSAGGHVSDGYWKEKLVIASSQEPEEWDRDITKARIRLQIEGGLQEEGFEGKQLQEMKQYMSDCLERCDDEEFDYQYFAYREYPSFCDTESVIFVKRTKYWLTAVFDGFDEVCRRIKENVPFRSSEAKTFTA